MVFAKFQQCTSCLVGFLFFQGNPLCPVASFKKYTQKLHPGKDIFWQRPILKRTPREEDAMWYGGAPLGRNSLSLMMKNIAREAGLIGEFTFISVKNINPKDIDEVLGWNTNWMMNTGGIYMVNMVKVECSNA